MCVLSSAEVQFFFLLNTASPSVTLSCVWGIPSLGVCWVLFSLRLWSRKDRNQDVTEFTDKCSLMSKWLKYFATAKIKFYSVLLRKMSMLALSLEENIFFKLNSIIQFLVLVISAFCLAVANTRKSIDKLPPFWQICLLTTLCYTS